jgi:hypothetical protein
MKKEQIYVTIDSEEKRLRAIEILDKAGEEILHESTIFIKTDSAFKQLLYSIDINGWLLSMFNDKKQEITLDQLESLLIPNYQVKDVILSLDELKQQAEKLGYDLVEKPYEAKVGDFGVFTSKGSEFTFYGYLYEIGKNVYFDQDEQEFPFFRKLTEEEKTKIQEAW